MVATHVQGCCCVSDPSEHDVCLLCPDTQCIFYCLGVCVPKCHKAIRMGGSSALWLSLRQRQELFVPSLQQGLGNSMTALKVMQKCARLWHSPLAQQNTALCVLLSEQGCCCWERWGSGELGWIHPLFCKGGNGARKVNV